MKIKIEKLIFGGAGLGRDKTNKPFFVKKSVPGDLLDIRIIKDKGTYAEGEIEEIVEPSDQRIIPICSDFDHCGGCDHQNIDYQDQLRYKNEIFEETLARARIEPEILPIIPGSNSSLFYRNTIRFFFHEINNQITLAMHDFADFRKLIPIKECLLQSKWTQNFMQEIVDFVNQNIEDKKSLSQLRIREGKATGDFLVEIITKYENLSEKQAFIAFLKKFPEIKSAYHTSSKKDNLWDAKRSLLFGSPIIYEKIGKFTFQISPESFFQTNSLGIKTLYDKIKEFASVKIGERVLDLYCGTGSIGIYLSMLAKEVVGVEEVQSAVNDAKANAKINKVINCNFICADATNWIKKQSNKEEIEQFDKIIVDPPREGLTKEIISAIAKLKIENLVYVSCNPATFARDIKEFEKYGLKLKKVQPVDMFPQTQHIECIGLIKK